MSRIVNLEQAITDLQKSISVVEQRQDQQDVEMNHLRQDFHVLSQTQEERLIEVERRLIRKLDAARKGPLLGVLIATLAVICLILLIFFV